MKKSIVGILVIIGVIFAKGVLSQSISDYLILQNIGQYSLDKPEKDLPGEPPSGGPRFFNSAGELAGAGHFVDHIDKTYEVMYLGCDAYASPTVKVTQHTGGDSDKWLLHEMETGYRDSDTARLGLLHKGTYIEKINNNIVMRLEIAGGSYSWLSNNNIVVSIEYSDPNFTKPEPKEIINAYLAKLPSAIPSTFKLNKDHEVTWLKDEMERRLWLCDKWFMQLQLRKADEKEVYRESFRSMNIFLDYREKYFGIAAKAEKIMLAGYFETNNGTGIKAKLKEYKDWWTANKEKSINL